MRFRLSTISVVAALALVVALGGCSADDDTNDDNVFGNSGGGGVTGGSSSGDDPDAGTDADATDAGDDAGDVAEGCDLEVESNPTDPRYPCCFDDEDCRDHEADGSENLRCYYAVCNEGAEGSCRTPPTQQNRCWSDADCPAGTYCPHENNAQDFQCSTPNSIETPATCREEQ